MNSTTVVISNYNYQTYVRCAIDSCISQDEPCDIIVVDDASTDFSWKVICNTIKDCDYPFIQAVRLKENSGGNARGKNVGIALSQTEYIICLDSDDALMPESISIRKKIFDNYKNIDWVHGKAVRLKTHHNYSRILNELRKHGGKYVLSKNMYKKEIMALPETNIDWYRCVEASTVMAKRYCYEKVGLYDEELKWKIDREMWYRFLNNDINKKFIENPVSVYRMHSKQVTKDRKRKDPDKVNDKFLKIIKERDTLTSKNTIMLDSYDANKYIQEIFPLAL